MLLSQCLGFFGCICLYILYGFKVSLSHSHFLEFSFILSLFFNAFSLLISLSLYLIWIESISPYLSLYIFLFLSLSLSLSISYRSLISIYIYLFLFVHSLSMYVCLSPSLYLFYFNILPLILARIFLKWRFREFNRKNIIYNKKNQQKYRFFFDSDSFAAVCLFRRDENYIYNVDDIK